MKLADYAKERMEDSDDDEEVEDEKDELYRKIGKLVCEAVKLTLKAEANGDEDSESSEDDDSE